MSDDAKAGMKLAVESGRNMVNGACRGGRSGTEVEQLDGEKGVGKIAQPLAPNRRRSLWALFFSRA